jgi:hypothetical protein
MKFLSYAALLTAVTGALWWFSISSGADESASNEPLLRVVIIRARSSIEVKQLRRMNLDIVRVRADPGRPPGEGLPSGGFIVEAVVTAGQLTKLKKMGFVVTEAPEKN